MHVHYSHPETCRLVINLDPIRHNAPLMFNLARLNAHHGIQQSLRNGTHPSRSSGDNQITPLVSDPARVSDSPRNRVYRVGRDKTFNLEKGYSERRWEKGFMADAR